MTRRRMNRRALLRLGASGGALAGAATALPLLLTQGNAANAPEAPASSHANHQEATVPAAGEHEGHSPSSTVGDVDVEAMGYDPSIFTTTFDYGDAYTDTDGKIVREYNIVAFDKEIEIA